MIPVWVCLCFIVGALVVASIRRSRHRKATTAVLAQLEVRHRRERDAQERRIAQLNADVERLSGERDDAVKQKTRFMYRLQELSRRVGDVVSIRPASGAARTKPRE